MPPAAGGNWWENQNNSQVGEDNQPTNVPLTDMKREERADRYNSIHENRESEGA